MTLTKVHLLPSSQCRQPQGTYFTYFTYYTAASSILWQHVDGREQTHLISRMLCAGCIRRRSRSRAGRQYQPVLGSCMVQTAILSSSRSHPAASPAAPSFTLTIQHCRGLLQVYERMPASLCKPQPGLVPQGSCMQQTSVSVAQGLACSHQVQDESGVCLIAERRVNLSVLVFDSSRTLCCRASTGSALRRLPQWWQGYGRAVAA